MKKTLLLFITSVMATLTCLAGTTVTTHTVSFVFNSSEGLSELGITAPATGKSVELTNGATYTLSDVTLTNTNSSNYINKVFNHNSYGLELYFYNGGSLSFSVPDDCNITQVKFKANNIKAHGSSLQRMPSGSRRGS